MPYTPTDWIDGVTPVDAARLDKMEAGIVAAEEKTLKAQANGYASLDSGGKVPLAQLPPVGADLAYNGAWVPTSYEDGDIVIGADNVAYMCVTPTNTAPEPWPGGPTPLPVASIPYGTSLPPSPADGQEAILVDSTTNPTYQWRFRFNSLSSSAYKWEFMGGAPRHLTSGTWTTSLANQWAAGPNSVTVPQAGEYDIRSQFRATNGTGLSGEIHLSTLIGGTRQGGYVTVSNVAVNGLASLALLDGPLVATAGAAFALAYYGTAINWTLEHGRLQITPVRVS